MIYDSAKENDRLALIDLEKCDIEECHSEEILNGWHVACRELCDDLIAQIETEKVAEFRGEDWVRRASGMLIGLKKKMKWIERHCAAIGIPNPKNADTIPDTITKLINQAKTARAYERELLIEWLESEFGDSARDIVEGIKAREHIRFHRAQQVSI